MSEFFKFYQVTPKSGEAEAKKEELKKEEPKKEEESKIATPNIIHKYLVGNEPREVRETREVKKEEKIPQTPQKRKIEVPPDVHDSIQEKIAQQLNLTKEAVDRYEKKKSLLDAPPAGVTDPGIAGVEYEGFENIKFMKKFPRNEMKHKHHSSIIVAMRCLREYFYSNVINFKPSPDANIFFPWGTSLHIFKQRLNEIYGYGDDTPKEYDSEKAKEAFKQASRQAIEYWMKNGEDQKADSKYDWFTTERLYKSMIKLFEFWVNERKEGKIKILAVEQFFNVQLSDGSYREGIIDEAIEIDGELWGRDLKSTSKPEEWFLRQFIINNQVRQYSFGNSKLSNRPVRGLVIQAIYNAKSTKKGDKGPLVYEKLVEVTDYELKQWELEQTVWNQILDLCRENDVWPQSTNACQFCDYFQVCSKPTEAAMMYTLENKFKRVLRDPYNSGIQE